MNVKWSLTWKTLTLLWLDQTNDIIENIEIKSEDIVAPNTNHPQAKHVRLSLNPSCAPYHRIWSREAHWLKLDDRCFDTTSQNHQSFKSLTKVLRYNNFTKQQPLDHHVGDNMFLTMLGWLKA